MLVDSLTVEDYCGLFCKNNPHSFKIRTVDYHGGSGGILPPSGVKGRSPLPLIVLIKICTVPNSLQVKEISKKI